MKNIARQLKVARKRIAEVEWFDLAIGDMDGSRTPKIYPIEIEVALLHKLSDVLFGVRDGIAVGAVDTMQDHYWRWVLPLGKPEENPAQVEIFVGKQRLPVFFSTVDGNVYATAEPMFAFE